MAKIEKLGAADSQSMDIVESNIQQLKELFPDVFAEGKINFDRLQEVLGNYVVTDEDHYNFTWHGKRQAGRLAQTPSTGTLRPCKEESVDWDKTQNLFIEGDNLEVLKLLQKSYHRQIKMIYIDPPYNTGNEFVYEDDFKDGIQKYLEVTGQIDSEGKKVGTNSNTSGRYHTNWLNMMYPRLKLARNLLQDDGAIFISIDDNELSNLRKICDEIFGEENFIAQIEWQKRYTRSNNTDNFTSVIDHIVVYAKSSAFQVNLIDRADEANARFTNPDNDSRGPWKATPFLNQVSPEKRPNLCYPIQNPYTGVQTEPTKKAWRYEKSFFEKLQAENRLWWGKEKDKPVPDIKTFLSEVREGMTPINFWDHKFAGNTDEANREIKELFDEKVFDTPKPTLTIIRMIEHACDENSLILDFFAGSASTAHAVYKKNASDQGNRRFILVQLPEQIPDNTAAVRCGYKTISDIAKERIRRAGKKIKEETPLFNGDLGFKFFKLDTSNIKMWEAGFDTLKEDLLNAVDYIKQDRSSDDVLFELLLKYGLDLTVPIETRTIAGKTVYSIGLGALVVCLDKDVSMDVVNGIGSLKEELKPEIMRVVFKDNGFQDDVVKTNALQTLKRFGIEDIKSL